MTAAIQVVVVVLTNSVALLADTVHNVGDALTAAPLGAAFILSRRPPTAGFTYGLKRGEDLAGLFIVLAIVFSAGFALYESIGRLVDNERPTYLLAGMIAGLIGFLGNEWVAVYRMRQGKRMQSAALVADGYHARVDGFTSLAVVAGLGAVWLGADIADPIVGILISVVIMGIAASAARDVGRRILDGIEPETVEVIRRAAEAELGDVASLRDVRARWVGHEIHAQVSLRPSGSASALDLIALRHRLERRLATDADRVRSLAIDVTAE